MCIKGSLSSPLAVLGLVASQAFFSLASFGEPVDLPWSQFRGPNGSAVSHTVGLIRAWPDKGLPEIWSRPLGTGFSSFAISADHFFTSFSENNRSYVGAFRLENGEEVWRLEIGESFSDEFGTGPRATPSLTDDRVVALSAQGVLIAAEAATGKESWRVDLYRDYGFYDSQLTITGITEPGHQLPQWGYSVSPLVEGGLVLVDSGHGKGESFLAFDLASGEKKWGALDSPVGYSSPVAISVGESRFLVVQTPEAVVGLGTDGTVRWRHPWFLSVAQPVFVPPDQIFVSTVNQDHTAEVFRILPNGGAEGEAATTEASWKNQRMRNFWNSSLFYRGAIYGFDNATLRCLDAATGDLHWARRGLGKGSLVVADDLLLILNDQGIFTVAEATTEGYRQLGQQRVFDASRIWSPMAIFGDGILLRGPDSMVALDLRKP